MKRKLIIQDSAKNENEKVPIPALKSDDSLLITL